MGMGEIVSAIDVRGNYGGKTNMQNAAELMEGSKTSIMLPAWVDDGYKGPVYISNDRVTYANIAYRIFQVSDFAEAWNDGGTMHLVQSQLPGMKSGWNQIPSGATYQIGTAAEDSIIAIGCIGFSSMTDLTVSLSGAYSVAQLGSYNLNPYMQRSIFGEAYNSSGNITTFFYTCWDDGGGDIGEYVYLRRTLREVNIDGINMLGL